METIGKKTMNKTYPSKVVIFGPDNSGKTTLAKALSPMIGAEYKHSLGPVSAREMIDYMVHNLYSDERVVFDRFPIIEEEVCGKALRGTNKLQEEFDIVYLSKVDLFIFCCPPLSVIKQFGEREQMEGVKENIEKLWLGYNHYFDYLSKIGMRVVKYDFTKDVLDEKIKEWLF